MKGCPAAIIEMGHARILAWILITIVMDFVRNNAGVPSIRRPSSFTYALISSGFKSRTDVEVEKKQLFPDALERGSMIWRINTSLVSWNNREQYCPQPLESGCGVGILVLPQ
jgi:hypothetical protein